MTLHTLLELAWLDAGIGKTASVKARVPQLIAQLAPIVDELPPLPLEYLLSDEWQRVRRPALLPALRRLWGKTKPPAEGERTELPDLILRRLRELAPAEGRTLILTEIRSVHPRAGIDALRSLPDATLPALDKTLLAHFNNNQVSDEVVLPLIERYASKAILPPLKVAYDHTESTWDYSLTYLLAYFMRVDPTYGVKAVQKHLKRYRTGYCELFTDLAALHMNPMLERLAIARLDDANVEVAANAAQMLGKYGSPQVEATLMARLRRTADLKYPRVRQRIEPILVEALSDAPAWLAGSAKLKTIRVLCKTAAGRSQADEYIRSRSQSQVHVDYSGGERGYWNVDHYTGQGLASLKAKLAQFPRGTLFVWQEIRFGKEADAVLGQLQAFVKARGMTMQRRILRPTIS